MRTIPVANIYYLLCYSWEEFAPRQMTALASETSPDTLHLFARLLASGVRILHRRGLDTGYVAHQEPISGIRGRLLMADTIRCLVTRPKHVVCAFDELSANILTNRIIRATITAVLGEPSLSAEMRAELRQALKLLTGVEDVRLEAKLFHQVPLNRNNRLYSFLLNVCRFFHESLEAADRPGGHRFRDVAREPERMRRIFEKFVRNFLASRLGGGFSVKRDCMPWSASAVGDSDLKFLPQMETDVTLRPQERTVVIECKYTEALYESRFFAEKLRPAHLYQLAAYLRNLEDHPDPDHSAEGLLLYPTVGESLHQTYVLHGHRVRVATVDLNQRWQEIEEELLSLMAWYT
jgi:5-methylcytosine-specific restriction enzyme subunit McrC